MKTTLNILLVCSLILMSKIGNSQTIDPLGTNPVSTRAKCGYKFNQGVPTNVFQNWIVPSPNAYLVNEFGHPDANVFRTSLYVKWKNVEASAYSSSCVLQVQYIDNLNITRFVSQSFGPFTLTFKTVTFVNGSSRNIPCYATSPVTIAVSNYVNTDDNYPYDKNEWITSQFEWTLPSGWQTTTGQTGTFVGLSSIVAIPPVSNSTVNVNVRAKASNQYSQSSTLQITRNLENFSIEGPTTATCYSTKRFTAPAIPSGVTYLWQLPSGWTGVANENYIDATVTGSSGTITCTMIGCGQSKVSTKAVTVNKVEPGTIISGPSSVCSFGTSFSINNLPTGATITWLPGSGITRVSAQGSNPCTFSSSGTGTGLIEATIYTNCGNITLPGKTVWKGVPVINSISGPQFLPYGGNWVYTANVSGAEGASYQWAVSPSLPLTSYGDNAEITFPSTNGDYRISLTVNGLCSMSSTFYYFVATGEYEPFIIFPNPATDETTLTLSSETSEKALDTESEWDLEVYSESQTLKTKQTKLRGKSAKIQTAGWKEGVYLVRVNYNDKVLTGKLLVKNR